MSQIEFQVKNQIITRTDRFRVVSDSSNYLYAQFNFVTDEWNDLIKTAEFRLGKNGTPYSVLLEDDRCLVPHEVLSVPDDYIYVSVFAGSLITVNVVKVFVEQSGYWGNAVPSVDPTPSVYAQIISRLEDVEDIVVESAESASQSASRAEQGATNAERDALKSEAFATGKRNSVDVENTDEAYHNNAKYYSEIASQRASSASTSSANASQSETNALSYKQSAQISANSASENANASNASATRAEQASATAVQNASQSTQMASNAEAYAVGKRGGTDVDSGDDAYHNNSKYYADQSAESARQSASYKATIDNNGIITF